MNKLSPKPSLSVSARDMVCLQQISKIYSAGDTEVQALKNIDLTVEKGDYCAIMGASGSGKSTLMNIIGCLDRSNHGKYYLDGMEVAGLSDEKLACIRNQKLGFIFQQFHLLSQLTALENVMLPMTYAGIGPSERYDRAVTTLNQVGLGNRLHNKPNQLSGGQQQRVAIARAIVNRPVLLLADEPTGALDSKTSQDVMDIFSSLHAKGITVIVITHESSIAHQTQHIIRFNDGQIVT